MTPLLGWARRRLLTYKRWQSTAQVNTKRSRLTLYQRGTSIFFSLLIVRSLTAITHRLLAHAGFDPRHALRFWEERGETEQTAECTPSTAKKQALQANSGYQMRWVGSAHPLSEVRIAKLREEFERWEKERNKALKQIEVQGAAV